MQAALYLEQPGPKLPDLLLPAAYRLGFSIKMVFLMIKKYSLMSQILFELKRYQPNS